MNRKIIVFVFFLDICVTQLADEFKKDFVPIDAKMGPSALARAPIDRNMPSTIPF